MIKCGNCGKSHVTAGEVRDCYGLQIQASVAAKVMDNMDGGERRPNPPSDRQVTYVADLLLLHDWPDEVTEEDVRAMERSAVSKLITQLKARPLRRQKVTGHEINNVPEGRYAFETADGWQFWQVDKPTEGKWSGYTFVKMLIGSPGDYRQQKVTGAVAKRVIKSIEEITPRQASINFGIKSETCGICHSPLTNPESIKYGIGPKCRGKMGW